MIFKHIEVLCHIHIFKLVYTHLHLANIYWGIVWTANLLLRKLIIKTVMLSTDPL